MAELTVPQINFAPLGQLGKVYQQAQAEQGVRDAFANGVPTDAMGLAQLGARVGAYNPQLGMSLSQLGITQQNRQQDVERQARQDAFQREESQRAQRNADRSYGLAARAAARAEEGPLEKMQARLKVLAANGIDPTSPEGRAYAIGGEWAGPGANAASLTPIFGTDADGKPAAIQPTKSGVSIPMKTPDGFSIAREPMKIDTGTSIEFYDPQTRNLIRSVPKNLEQSEIQKARGGVIGEANAKAEVSAQGDYQAGQNALDILDKIEKHPYIDRGTGFTSKLNAVPGTGGYDFQNIVDQAKSGAFLTAIQQMRGLGALSNTEGQTATAAVTRMNTATSKEAFLDAAADYRKIIQQGMTKASSRGVQTPAMAPPQRGQLIDGYRFKGGDPGDKNNWVKQP